MTLVDEPCALAGLAPGIDVDLALRALDVAASLPADGPEQVLAAVRGSDNRWSALAGAKEILRSVVLADRTALLPTVALGIVTAAVRIEVDRRRASTVALVQIRPGATDWRDE